MTQEDFHKQFPGIDYGMFCTVEHPDGTAPGSMAWLIKAGAISLNSDSTVTVYDADRVRSMIAEFMEKR